MAVQLAEGVLKSRESSSSSTWNNIMVEVSPNVDTETVASNFAAPYNSSSTYNKNDTCIHDNIFYTCKQDGVTGNWDSTKWEVSTVGGVQDKLLSLHDDIGIVIDGKRPSMAVTSGQYVIVRNSTISGITDGLYKANATLSTSTDVTAANLTAVTGGGLNALNDNITNLIDIIPITKSVGQSIPSNNATPVYIDISQYKSLYQKIAIFGDASANGSNYYNFNFLYGYIEGDNVVIALRNVSSSSQTLSSLSVSLLCIYPK